MSVQRPLSRKNSSIHAVFQVDNSQLFEGSPVEKSTFLDISEEEQLLPSESFSILGKRTKEDSTIQVSPKRKKIDYSHQQAGPATCKWNDCNESFASLSMLGCHLTDHIKQQKTLNRSNKKSGYHCKWKDCKRSTPFKGCYNLEHHLRYQHTGEKPFQCKYCSSSFAQRSDMTEHLYNIHNRKPTKKRGRNKTQATNLYSNYTPTDCSDKVQQLMMPRSRPIPILPAPQQITYLDGTFPPQSVSSGLLRQSIIMPNDPNFFFAANRLPKYLTESNGVANDPTAVNFNSQHLADSESDNYLMGIPFYAGYPYLQSSTNSLLSSSNINLRTPNPLNFSGEFNDTTIDNVPVFSFISNAQISNWMENQGEVEKEEDNEAALLNKESQL